MSEAPAPGAAQAAKTHEKLARSASALTHSANVQEDSADRRTQLAADRTVLAAERTYAAWMRTGLGALASAIGAKTLFAGKIPDWLATGAGVVLLCFAMFCFVAGVWRQIVPGPPPPRPDVRRLPMGLLVGFNGFLVALCVAVLVGFVVA